MHRRIIRIDKIVFVISHTIRCPAGYGGGGPPPRVHEQHHGRLRGRRRRECQIRDRVRDILCKRTIVLVEIVIAKWQISSAWWEMKFVMPMYLEEEICNAWMRLVEVRYFCRGYVKDKDEKTQAYSLCIANMSGSGGKMQALSCLSGMTEEFVMRSFQELEKTLLLVMQNTRSLSCEKSSTSKKLRKYEFFIPGCALLLLWLQGNSHYSQPLFFL